MKGEGRDKGGIQEEGEVREGEVEWEGEGQRREGST